MEPRLNDTEYDYSTARACSEDSDERSNSTRNRRHRRGTARRHLSVEISSTAAQHYENSHFEKVFAIGEGLSKSLEWR